MWIVVLESNLTSLDLEWGPDFVLFEEKFGVRGKSIANQISY